MNTWPSMGDKQGYSPQRRNRVSPSPALMCEIQPGAGHPTNGDPTPLLNLVEERLPLPAAALLMAAPKPAAAKSFRPLIEWQSVEEAQHEERESTSASGQTMQGRWKPLGIVSPHMYASSYKMVKDLPDCVARPAGS